MDYISQGKLSIAGVLYRFVNNELLPSTGIDPKKFWNGLDKHVHELAPKNKKLIEVRENLQKKIDDWHKNKKGKKINSKNYLSFLKKIDYIKKEKKNFQIKTENVDKEISKVPGPQLVVPVMNARYALNAQMLDGVAFIMLYMEQM